MATVIAKIINVSSVPLASMLIALAWGTHPAAAQTSGTADNWSAMTTCATIANNDARHACSDDVLRAAGLLKTAEVAAPVESAEPVETVETAVPELAQTRQAANLTTPEREAFLPTEQPAAAAAKDIDRVDFTLKTVTKAGNGKLTLTTTDGVVWRQLYSESMLLKPRAGAVMTVRKRAMGAYQCRIGKGRAFRCQPNS